MGNEPHIENKSHIDDKLYIINNSWKKNLKKIEISWRNARKNLENIKFD